jgi:hypothetical protein
VPDESCCSGVNVASGSPPLHTVCKGLYIEAVSPSPQHESDSGMNEWTRSVSGRDATIAASLFVLSLGTRIPFAARTAFSSDAARFALAMQHYDVTQMRPHAPGYVLYIAVARIFDFILRDATTSLVAVSVVASAATVALTYLFATRMYSRTTGLISALLLLTSPLFWFNGGMPLTYALEGMLTLAFVAACYQVILGKSRWLYTAAVLLGLTAGVRQNLILVLAPLLLYAMRKCSARQIAAAVSWCALTCLAWLVPMAALAGGVAEYWGAVKAQYGTWVEVSVPFATAVKIRSLILLKYLMYSLCLGAIPVLYNAGRMFSLPNLVRDERVRLLLLWLVPAGVFFLGLNIYNPGHVVFLLPALFIVLGESVKTVAVDLQESAGLAVIGLSSHWTQAAGTAFSQKAGIVACVAVIAITNTLFFVRGSSEVSYSAIALNDRQLEELVKTTREKFSPERSMVVTCRSNTQAGLYLPEFLVCCPLPLIFKSSDVPIERQNVYMSRYGETSPKTYWMPTGFRIEPIPIPDGIDTLIFWEEEVAGYCRSPERLMRLPGSTASGSQLTYMKVKPGSKISYDYHLLSVD